MMGNQPKQISKCRWSPPRVRREAKKALRRFLRRLVKKDPENASERATRGWVD